LVVGEDIDIFFGGVCGDEFDKFWMIEFLHDLYLVDDGLRGLLSGGGFTLWLLRLIFFTATSCPVSLLVAL
jgi:hypothetical protein